MTLGETGSVAPGDRGGEIGNHDSADQPAMTGFGRCSLASVSTSAISTRWSLSPHVVRDRSVGLAGEVDAHAFGG